MYFGLDCLIYKHLLGIKNSVSQHYNLHEPLTRPIEWSWSMCAHMTMCAPTSHSEPTLHEPLTTLSEWSCSVCACLTMWSVWSPTSHSEPTLHEPLTTLSEWSWSVCACLTMWSVCALTNHSVLALHVRFLCFIIARNFRINESNPNIYCLWVVSCSM